MKNSKRNETLRKWLDRIGWIASILAKFMPANMKVLMVTVSTIAGGLVALLDRCDQNDKPPASVPSVSPSPTASPSPSPTQTPTPIPTPTKPPLPELKAPRYVKAGEKFKVELCNVGNRYDVSIYAEKYRLAYIGFGKPCMFVHISLNQKGKRELMAIGPDNLRVFADVIVQ